MIAPKVEQQTAREEREAYELVEIRDRATCVRCGSHEWITRDHRRNRSQGGRTVVENLQLLCGSGTTGCHGWATTHPKEAVEQGFAVPGWAEPGEWPARRMFLTDNGARILGWCFYLPNGRVQEISAETADRRMAGGA